MNWYVYVGVALLWLGLMSTLTGLEKMFHTKLDSPKDGYLEVVTLGKAIVTNEKGEQISDTAQVLRFVRDKNTNEIKQEAK
jgi:hypothetical protein